ncbi:MAG: divergent polysaccharide deacetylase family protein, partial [bacterium]
RVMRAVLGVVRDRRLIFVDSMTSPRSIAARIAAEMDIPTAARTVFLDNEDEPAAIRAQIRRLITVAKQRGEAIAIGHAQRSTASVLLSMLDEFEKQGVELVPISTLVR